MSFRKQMILGVSFLVAIAVGFVLLPALRLYSPDALFGGKTARIRQRQESLLSAITSDPARYRAFYRKYQFFNQKMEEQQREDLREIRNRIESDPQSGSLNLELAKYTAWLNTVPHHKQRIDAAKTIEERIEIIREIKDEQKRFSGSLREYALPGFSPDDQMANIPEEERRPTSSQLAEILENADPQTQTRLLGFTPQELIYELETQWNNERQRYTRSLEGP